MKKATTTEGSASATTKAAPAKRATSPVVKTTRPKATPAPVTATNTSRVPATVVSARIDVGFGNRLYIRGDGPGLSWDQGVPMECASSDTWTWTSAAASRPFAFKVLINDERWSNGDDFVASVGTENPVSPAF
jgi:hypothetical protein